MSDGRPDASISPTQWRQFHQELRAAVLSRVPLELGAAKSSLPGGTANISKLAILESSVQSRRNEADDVLPDRYRAGLHVFERTGEMPLVLEGLATGSRSRLQLARMLHSTLGYLSLVILVAYFGLLFFSTLIMPSVHHMRDDMQLVPRVDAPQRFDGSYLLDVSLVLFPLGLLALFVILILMGGSATIASFFGGRRYQIQRASATAVRTTRALLSRGMSRDEAILLGCDLVGGGVAVRQQVDASLGDRSSDVDTADRLEALADHLQASAANRMAVLRVVLPIALIAIVGGAVVMTSALAVFLPVIAILKDFALPGI